MRFLRRSLAGLFLVALTIALLALAGETLRSAIQERLARESDQGTARERVYSVNVMTVEPGEIVPVLEAFGEVRARRTLELRAQVAGSVVELGQGFEEGGRVEAGQLLLRVDPTNLQDSLALARTDLAEAQDEQRDAGAALDIARDDLASAQRQAELRAQALARQQDLAQRGVGTEAAVETAALSAASAEQAVLSRRSALASAEARVAQAENTLARRQIALDEAARRLAETEVRASFSGTLADVAAIEGRLVTANEHVATLVDPSALEVSFRLSTAQYARLLDSDGALVPADVSVRLAVSGVDIEAVGRIDRESAEVGEGQTGRLLFARLEDVRGFRPGDFVTVEIREPALRGVAELPASALGATDTVLVLGAEDRLEEVSVTVLRRQGETVLVRAGDLAGREVVTERTPMLGAGIGVKPFRPGAAAAPAQSQQENMTMIALDDERRAKLIAFVTEENAMQPAMRERMLFRLNQPEVSEQFVQRLEQQMGE
ncbi:efflux RND transporter periplasmic adaptor subunit [Sinisalibacter aestuarii]|uniref:Hemolysin D n=1 Tax=Sinisalibacter aestuarii TaxID=2949426 RepID=A0ABQ5LMQ5_9RHOB|nr:HlyD family efflux transporter periplasmic adaptor subunit [Sinisalibacter aestuarii]GKY86292.1 hemolysin D [Sinisalibacter aestuarii]